MSSWRISGAILAFTITFIALFYLMLPACGVAGSYFLQALSYCVVPSGEYTETLREADEDRIALERQIAAMQQDLALRQCGTEIAEVDENLWKEQDISVLDGCWRLDFDYRVTDITTEEEIVFDDWSLCFDGEASTGAQRMQSTSGVICQSLIPGFFNEQNQLVLEETDNLTCNDSSFIFRRQITCDRTEDGRLECVSIQPDRSVPRDGWSSRFQMSRQ